MQIKLNLPLNAVNQKKPRMPNVANRVDAFVIFKNFDVVQSVQKVLYNQPDQ